MRVLEGSRLFAIAAVCAAAPTAATFAQTSAADIQGSITDPSGAMVANATVTLTNVDTGVNVSAPSPNGAYRFPEVAPGHYTLSFTAAGFQNETISGLNILLGMHVQKDVALPLGTAQQTVTTTADLTAIDTSSNVVGGVITNRQINTLPLNTRQYLNLALLLPGTSQDASRTFYNNVQIGGGGTFYANGFRIDGVSNNWAEQGEPRQNIPEGAVQEFKVDVTQYPAEYGLSEGGLVTIVTKSGTNAYHGELFEYFRNQDLNRLNRFQVASDKAEGVGKPPFLRNQFGGDIGGPIVHDRTHFYAAYERTQTDDSYTIFTAAPQDYGALSGTFDEPSHDQLLTGRVDHQISNTQQLFVRYAQEWNLYTAQSCGGNAERNCYDGLIPRWSLVGGHTWTLSPNLLNDFRVQYARASYQLGPHGAPIPTNAKGYSPSTLASLQTAYIFPSFSYGAGYADVGLEQRYEALDTVSLQRGTHSIKVGFDGSIIPFTDNTAVNYSGTYTFNKDQVFNPANPASLAALTKPVSFTSSTPSLSNTEDTRQLGIFGEDSWKPFARLTIDYGLRYDREYGSFNEQLGNTTLPQRVPYMGNPGHRGDGNNFAPRIGFSLDPTGHGLDVLRGGFGIYYGNIQTLQNFNELRDLAQCNVSLNNPSYPNPYNGGTASQFCTTAAPTVTVLAPNTQNPYSEQTSLGYSRQISPNLSINIDGLYTHTVRDYRVFDLNYPVAGKRPLTAWNQILQHGPEGAAKYGALFVRLDKRFAQRYMYTVSYTYSSSRDNNPQGTVVNYADPQLDWGPSAIDRRHSLIASGSYLAPGKVMVSAIWSLRTSLPFNAFSGITNADATTQYVPGTSRDQGNRNLNLAAVNTFRTGYSLAAVTHIDSSLYNDLDLRASRSFFEHDGKSLEIVAQVFNLAGHENLLNSAMTTSARSSTFGTITNASNLQQVELAAHFVF